MSRMICLPSLKVKPTRKTARPSAPFGAGILASRPFAGRMPFTYQDTLDAAQMFADESTPDYDAMAMESAYYDQFNGSFPETGHCLLCGDRTADLTSAGLCDRCDDRAMDATTACRNASVGLGFNVF
jgi:hypothetical protein